MRSSALASLTTLSLLAANAAGQQDQLFELYGDGQIDRFGSAIATGDIDGDGFTDILSGAPLDDEGGFSHGSAQAFSGLTGTHIRSHFGTQSTSMYGSAVGLADVNGDGHADPVVGDRWFEFDGTRYGRVWVYSGLDGSILHTLDGLAPNDNFGQALTGVGDIDGDGMEEFAIGAPLDDRAGNGAGSVTLYDGATGAVVRTTFGPTAGAQLGMALACAGDVDADGWPDLVAGMIGESTNGHRSGAMYAVSGRTGIVLRTHFGALAGDYLGESVAGAGDVDGDGFDDLIVGATQFPMGPGYAQVVSGQTGAVLHTKMRGGAACLFGSSVSGAGDVNGDGKHEFAVGFVGFCHGIQVFDGATGALLIDDQPPFTVISGYGSRLAFAPNINGDGVPDLVTGASNSNHLVTNGGSVHALSLASLSLSTDLHLVSAATGGTQTLTLDAGPSRGGNLYWILGSSSGIAPGLPVGGQLLPLNGPDVYLTMTIGQPNTSLMPMSLGTLDASGTASVSFILPPGSTSLVGVSVHHAYLAFELAPLVIHFASNAAPFTVVD